MTAALLSRNRLIIVIALGSLVAAVGGRLLFDRWTNRSADLDYSVDTARLVQEIKVTPNLGALDAKHPSWLLSPAHTFDRSTAPVVYPDSQPQPGDDAPYQSRVIYSVPSTPQFVLPKLPNLSDFKPPELKDVAGLPSVSAESGVAFSPSNTGMSFRILLPSEPSVTESTAAGSLVPGAVGSAVPAASGLLRKR